VTTRRIEMQWSQRKKGHWFTKTGIRIVQPVREIYELYSGAKMLGSYPSLQEAQRSAERRKIEGITVSELLNEALDAIKHGSETEVSEPCRTVLLATAKAVKSTWTATYGGIRSWDSVTVLEDRLAVLEDRLAVVIDPLG
jgi:hypothetical protein